MPVDLRQDWPAALRSYAFRADQPGAWLLEGLLMYLTQAEDRLVAQIIGLSTSGSCMALEPPNWQVPAHLAPTVARGVLDQSAMAMALRLSQAAAGEAAVADPAGWLGGWGWQVLLYDVAERFAAYGRDPSPGVAAMLRTTRRWLATAERLDS